MTIPSMSGSYYFSAGTRHVVPHKEGTGSQPTVMSSLEQVTSHAKEIPNQLEDSLGRPEAEICERVGGALIWFQPRR